MEATQEETLGAMVKRLRGAKNLDEKQLAGKCDCDEKTIKRIEADICYPTLHTAEWLSVVLEVSLDTLSAKKLNAKRAIHLANEKLMGFGKRKK